MLLKPAPAPAPAKLMRPSNFTQNRVTKQVSSVTHIPFPLYVFSKRGLNYRRISAPHRRVNVKMKSKAAHATSSVNDGKAIMEISFLLTIWQSGGSITFIIIEDTTYAKDSTDGTGIAIFLCMLYEISNKQIHHSNLYLFDASPTGLAIWIIHLKEHRTFWKAYNLLLYAYIQSAKDRPSRRIIIARTVLLFRMLPR